MTQRVIIIRLLYLKSMPFGHEYVPVSMTKYPCTTSSQYAPLYSEINTLDMIDKEWFSN